MDSDLSEIMDTAVNYLARLISGILPAADEIRFQAGSSAEAVGDITEGLGWLTEAFGVLAANKLIDFMPDEASVMDIINRIGQCLQRFDYIYLADILEYEIYPLLSKWREVHK